MLTENPCVESASVRKSSEAVKALVCVAGRGCSFANQRVAVLPAAPRLCRGVLG